LQIIVAPDGQRLGPQFKKIFVGEQSKVNVMLKQMEQKAVGQLDLDFINEPDA
jgi:hypothetical protein